MVSEAELFYLVVLVVLTLILHLVLAQHDRRPH